ncbi:MAG: hypothetical protein JOZ29_16430 [Deltaproteobacteria bacterium]|nr:hypothetical protein [Deltaproteobacteria bacterium]
MELQDLCFGGLEKLNKLTPLYLSNSELQSLAGLEKLSYGGLAQFFS